MLQLFMSSSDGGIAPATPPPSRALPASTVMAKLDASKVTVCFRPAMVHLPADSDTLTSGAPRSAREAGGWSAAAQQVEDATRTRNRGIVFMLFCWYEA
jgi:hypothetical protein